MRQSEDRALVSSPGIQCNVLGLIQKFTFHF